MCLKGWYVHRGQQQKEGQFQVAGWGRSETLAKTKWLC